MPYSFLEHTADVRMRVTGKTRDELFHDALLGMVAIMHPSGQTSKAVVRTITLEAVDSTALLIDFLGEALAWMHRGREAYVDVTFRAVSNRSLKADLVGYVAEAFGEDIKAVTYHEAEVKKDAKGAWETNIVFDI